MHFRRLATLLLGAWIGIGAFMIFVATQNFKAVDRLLADPGSTSSAQIKTLGHDDARILLRRQAGAQNRWLFEQWERIQFGLALALFLTLLVGPADKTSLGLCVFMAFIVFAQHFYFTPEMIGLGASTESTQDKFVMLHQFYGGLEVVKLVAGLGAAVKVMRRSRRDSVKARDQVDVINKTHHRHVNR